MHEIIFPHYYHFSLRRNYVILAPSPLQKKKKKTPLFFKPLLFYIRPTALASGWICHGNKEENINLFHVRQIDRLQERQQNSSYGCLHLHTSACVNGHPLCYLLYVNKHTGPLSADFKSDLRHYGREREREGKVRGEGRREGEGEKGEG